VSQNLPQGAGLFMCYMFLLAGERLSFSPRAGAAASPQAVLSCKCEKAAVIKLWLSWPAWVVRSRRNHLFRNQADSEVIT